VNVASTPSVGLAMIVKNEARILPRLAASLEGQYDHWTIVDTGSTDDTVRVAEEVFSGVPGAVVRDEWRGYGPSRNVALALSREQSDFVLTMDADETFHGVIERQIPPGFDGAEVEYHFDSLYFWLPRLLRSEAPWEWRARTHEYLAMRDRPARLYQTKSFFVRHHGDGGNRATKYERDLALLNADLRENPTDPRTAFYLARTYEDCGDLAQAAQWYERRIALKGWEEETWYATWRLACCLLGSERADEGCGALWRAWGMRPWRAEPLWSLAEYYRTTAQWRLSFEACQLARRECGVGDPENDFHGDRLFVHLDVYQWRIDYELSISAYYCDARELGRTLIEELAARTDIPEVLARNVTDNRRFYDS
jgi:glycosyltransferase involved in cell wall biosynthesis